MSSAHATQSHAFAGFREDHPRIHAPIGAKRLMQVHVAPTQKFDELRLAVRSP